MSRRLTRGVAIKKYCKESCCAGDLKSWKECPSSDCFLWRFRLGKEVINENTSIKRSGTEGVNSNQKQPSELKEEDRNGI